MKIIILICMMLIPAALLAQENDRGEYRVDVISDVYFQGYTNVRFQSNTSAYGIQGSRFVFEEFLPSNVYFSNKTIAPDKLMNYDCYMDQVVYSDSTGKYVLAGFNIDYIEFVPSEDSIVFFKKVILPEEKDIVFMRILYEGRSSLYKRYVKKLVVKDEQPTFNWDDKYANEFIIRTTYYIRLPGREELVQVPSRKNSLVKMMSPLEQSVKSYLKTERLNIKKEGDLIKLLEYYDKLLENGAFAGLPEKRRILYIPGILQRNAFEYMTFPPCPWIIG